MISRPTRCVWLGNGDCVSGSRYPRDRQALCLSVEQDSWKPQDIYIFNLDPGFHHKPLLGNVLDELSC